MVKAYAAVRTPGVWSRLLWALFALGLVAALVALLPRLAFERDAGRVELILDGPSLIELSRRTGTPLADMLASVAEIAPFSLAVEEQTVIDVVLAGHVGLVRAGELRGVPELPAWLRDLLDVSPNSAYLVWPGGEVAPELATALEERLQAIGLQHPTASGTVVWEIPPRPSPVLPGDGSPRGLPNPNSVLQLGLGYDPHLIALALDAGLAVSPRPHHRIEFTQLDVEANLSAVPPESLGSIVISGSWVPGYPHRVDDWAAALLAYDASVAWIEFARQIGLDAVVERSGYRTVRLHSISAAELRSAPPDVVMARWLRAVRERGIRALYVRPYVEGPTAAAAADLWAWNAAYLQRLAGELTGAGFSLGTAVPRRIPPIGTVHLWGMFGAVGVAGVWLVRRFVRLRPLTEAALLTGTLGGFAWLQFAAGLELARQAAALGAAVALPTLAALSALSWAGGRREPSSRAALASGQALAIATCISLSGALLVAGLLSETRFVLGLAQFRGVKAMHVLPPLLVAAGLLWGSPVRTLSESWRRIRRGLQLHIPLWHFLWIGAVAALAGVIVLRTGSDVLPVPEVERWMRGALEAGLGIRPRTKEFLIGHPAILLAVWLVLRGVGGAGLRALVAAVGSIGQLSLVNTFAHIHSPVAISLARTAYGVLLGVVVGAILIALADWTLRRLLPRVGGPP